MITFIIGLVILFGGAALYGKFCEKVFGLQVPVLSLDLSRVSYSDLLPLLQYRSEISSAVPCMTIFPV